MGYTISEVGTVVIQQGCHWLSDLVLIGQWSVPVWHGDIGQWSVPVWHGDTGQWSVPVWHGDIGTVVSACLAWRHWNSSHCRSGMETLEQQSVPVWHGDIGQWSMPVWHRDILIMLNHDACQSYINVPLNL